MKPAPLIAIVDDDDMVRSATRGLVESFGYNVEPFVSAEAFLGSEWPRKAHCLIADMQMPGMSGPELFRHLVNSGIDIPVIFITAFPNRERFAIGFRRPGLSHTSQSLSIGRSCLRAFSGR